MDLEAVNYIQNLKICKDQSDDGLPQKEPQVLHEAEGNMACMQKGNDGSYVPNSQAGSQ